MLFHSPNPHTPTANPNPAFRRLSAKSAMNTFLHSSVLLAAFAATATTARAAIVPVSPVEGEPDYWCHESHLTDGIGKYGKPGDTWQRRCELYLLDCGVTAEEIARLRTILLEPAE